MNKTELIKIDYTTRSITMKSGNAFIKQMLIDKSILDLINDLQERIDKAIEYIEKYTEYYDIELGIVNMEGVGTQRVPIINSNDIKNILKGDDKDENSNKNN